MEEKQCIYGEKIYLRPIMDADTADIIRWRNSDSVRAYFIYQKPFTEEGHRRWLQDMIYSGNGYQFIICEKDTGQAVGCTYLRDYNREHHKIEYGIYLGEAECKGKGYGTEALKLTVDFAFNSLNVHKVTGRIMADNIPSLTVSERAGFQREALLKGDVYVNGSYRDIVLVGKKNPKEQ